jgi:hypothetical protein
MTASDPSTLRQAQGRPEQSRGATGSGSSRAWSRDGRGPLLVRTFFSRLFESELMPPGLPQVRLLIWSAALIIGPGVYLPVNMWGRYVYLARWHPEQLQPAIWGDKLQLLLLAMIPAGLISLVIWDGVFPDRRDAHIMSVLPITNRAIVVARLAALGLVLGLISLLVGVPVALLYGTLVGQYQGGFLPAVVGNFLSSGLATAFVFCSVLAVQSILVTVARGRWVHRLIVWGQFSAVILLLQMVIFRGAMVGELRRMLDASVAHADGLATWAPPLWFLGFSEVIAGSPGDAFRFLAWRAVLVTTAVAAVAILLYIISYHRLVHRALETQEVPLAAAPSLLSRLGGQLARPLAAARPIAYGVFAFAVASFARSRQHRLLYGIYIGVGCAIALAGLVRVAAQGWTAAAAPSGPILSVSLVLTFLAAVGARVLFAIPMEPAANWVFRLTERASVRSHVAGARIALLLISAGPPVALFLPVSIALWGWGVAAAHAVYVLALAWLLVEALMWRFGRVPFTCPYVPGKANVRLLWPLYLTLFTTYAYTMAELEVWLLGRPRLVVASIAFLAGAAFIVSRLSARLGRTDPLMFDPEAEEEATTLALSSP